MGNNLILKNISELVTPAGNSAAKGADMNNVRTYKNATVICEDGKIVYAGENPPKKDESKYTVIDCSGKTVLPGFVDSHTHLVFGGYRANEFMMRQSGASYKEIMMRGGGIASTVKATRAASFDELVDSGLARINELKSCGVTCVEIKSGYGLDKETEIKQLKAIERLKSLCGIDVVATYMGAHSVPAEYKGRNAEYIKFMLNEILPLIKRDNLAEYVDIFCEEGVYSTAESEYFLAEAQKAGFKTRMHADEIVSLGGAELAAKLGCASCDHLLKASNKGIEDLAASGTVATLLPLTAFSLKEDYADARRLIDHGASVALATDFNPGSCFSSSVPLMIAISVIYMKMTLAEVITALTLNGACALGRGKTHGTIEAGKSADMVILRYPQAEFMAYHTGVNCVETVIKNAKVLTPKY